MWEKGDRSGGGARLAPLQVEIVTYAPTEFFHCLHCELVLRESGVGAPIHAEQRASALPPELAAEYGDVARWAAELRACYGDRISFRVVDVASLEGFAKVLRHRLRRFPAFLIDGVRCDASAGMEAVTRMVEARLA